MAIAASSLGRTQATATELTNLPTFDGLIVPRGLYAGIFFSRRGDGTGHAFEAAAGRKVRHGKDGMLFAFQVAGAYGTAYLECYRKRDTEDWKEFVSIVSAVAGSEVPSPPASLVSGQGSDVTVGTFSVDNTAGGTQVYLGGTALAQAGATQPCLVTLNAAPGNTQSIYVAETSALAVANNGELGAAGQDAWAIPAGGKLFIKAATAAVQIVAARVRS